MGLPTVTSNTNLECGLGTGTHGGDFAFSGGCASYINQKLSINYAASMIMPGQDYAGDFEDTFSARAGFIWKLGKVNKKELNRQKEKQLDQRVNHLQNENKELKSLIAKQNSRLEKLEDIASALKLKKDLEIISMFE